ncbi:MAG: helix-turn-helix domain-containing protein, partial [Bacteroides sp.]
MAHLTLEQRYTIQVLREEKLSQQAIANRIGK